MTASILTLISRTTSVCRTACYAVEVLVRELVEVKSQMLDNGARRMPSLAHCSVERKVGTSGPEPHNLEVGMDKMSPSNSHFASREPYRV